MSEAVARTGRQPKAESQAQERRRRKSGEQGGKLSIPQDIIDKHPDMEFRWARDDEGRIQQLTQSDDWDKVSGVNPIHAGVGSSGSAMKHHLLMKPKKFMEEDRAEKMARIDALMSEDAIKRPVGKEEALDRGATEYAVPGNKI